MNTIVLPDFMATSSAKKASARGLPRLQGSSGKSGGAGAMLQPRYRIRWAAQGQGRMAAASRPAPVTGGQQLAAEGSGVAPRQSGRQASSLLPLPRRALRLTRRGRLVLRGIPALTLAALILLGALAFLYPTEAKSSTTGLRGMVSQTITVAHGDSLWTIASELAPSQDSRDVINQIMQINNLTSTRLEPGQVLEVPVYSAD